jgi:hypothetical protein
VKAIFQSSELRAGTLPHLILMAWHRAPTAGTIREIESELQEHHRRYAEDVVIVNSILGGAPDDAARKAFQELGRASLASVAGVVMVLPRGGLINVVARTVVAGLNAAAPFPMRVATSVDHAGTLAATMLSDRRLPAPSANEVAKHLRTLSAPG